MYSTTSTQDHGIPVYCSLLSKACIPRLAGANHHLLCMVSAGSFKCLQIYFSSCRGQRPILGDTLNLKHTCRHGGGVLKNLSDSLVAVIIPEGAHHIDLMFSNELDPPSVKQARAFQLDNIRKWIAEVDERNQRQLPSSPLSRSS